MLILWIINDASAWNVKYSEQGAECHWKLKEIPFYINANSKDLNADLVTDSFISASQKWLNSEIEFVYEGTTKEAVPQIKEDIMDGVVVNKVYFEQDWLAKLSARGAEELGPDVNMENVMALTLLWNSASSGQIVAFDVVFNDETFNWRTEGSQNRAEYDLQNAMVHEFGHVLGLDHSTVEDATMYYAIENTKEQEKRTLHQDDREGRNYLYTPSEDEEQETPAEPMSDDLGAPVTEKGCSTSTSQSSHPFLLFLIAIIGLRSRSS